MGPHLSDEAMTRFLTDEVSPTDTAADEAHLRVCRDCQAKMNALTAAAPAVAAALRPPDLQLSGLSAAPPGLELLGPLGAGKTALVYRARQPRLGRIVALKVLCGGWPTEEETQQRFQREIEAAASQIHPGVVQVFEVGTHEGRPFLVMEYCAGGSLAARLRDGPLPPRAAAELLEALARTLQAVHTAGFVHRDLKPANVLFDGADRPKVADFGVVKRLDAADTPTSTGGFCGTPPYLAPEQIDGSSPAGPPCDIYALGAILYECLSGRPPFRAEPEALFDVLSREPLPPSLHDPRLPRDLETVCLKCLEKEPARRYGTAVELADDLRRFLDGLPVKARRIGAAGRVWRWGRRNRLAALLAGLLALAVIAGLALGGRFWYQAVQSRQEAEDARREAEENFLRTRRLLPDLVAAGAGRGPQAADQRQARRAALERACGLYRDLCGARPDDRELRGELAEVLTALAEAALSEERYEAARDGALEALTLWRSLTEEGPAEPRWRIGRVHALLRLGTAQDRLGHLRGMTSAYREAIALAQRLADEGPDDTQRLLESAGARTYLSGALFGEGQIDESLSLLEENRRQLESHLVRGFDLPEMRLALVQTLCRLGQYYQVRGDAPGAIRCWRAGCDRGAGLAVALPKEPSAWYFPTACALWSPRTDPSALTPAKAIPHLEQAVRLLEACYALDAESIWEFLAEVSRCLAACYLDAGRPADALRVERRAAEVMPARPAGSPVLALVRLERIAGVARRERQAGEPEPALRHAREVADGFEAFCRTHDADPAVLAAAVDYCPRLAPPLRHAGATDQSRRVVARALRVARQQAGPNADAEGLRRLSEVWLQQAKCCMRDEPGGVETALREAVDAARRRAALAPENRYLLDDRLSRLARFLGGHGRRAEAAACLRECARLWPRDADGLRGVARSFRELAGEVSHWWGVLSAAERDEQQEYLAEAVRLEKAAEALSGERGASAP